MPNRHQHLRRKGAKLPKGCMLVTRASRWGNPFHVPDIRGAGVGSWNQPAPYPLWSAHFTHLNAQTENGTTPAGEAYRATRDRLAVTHAVALYRTLAELFRTVDPAGFEDWIAPLRGHDLACSCPLDQPCHADVLLELANA